MRSPFAGNGRHTKIGYRNVQEDSRLAQAAEAENLVASGRAAAPDHAHVAACSIRLGEAHARTSISCHEGEEFQVPASADLIPASPGQMIYCACRDTAVNYNARGPGGELREYGSYMKKLLQYHPAACNESCVTQLAAGRSWRVLGAAQLAALRPFLNYNESEINAARHAPDSAAHDYKCLIGCRMQQLYAGSSTQLNATGIVLAHHSLVFTAHQDHKIRVWKRQNISMGAAKKCRYQLLNTLPTRRDYFLNCFCQHNYVRVRRHHHCLWIQHADAISALAFTGAKNSHHTKNVCKTDYDDDDNDHLEPLLYSASWDKTFKVWRLSDFKCMESVTAHDDAINAIALGSCCEASMAYQQLVFTASSDGTVKAWAKKSIYTDRFMRKSCLKIKHKLVATVAHHNKCAVNAIAMSNDGVVLFSAGSDGFIRVWRISRLAGHNVDVRNYKDGGDIDPEQKQLVNITLCSVLGGHKRAVLCLSIAGDLLLSGSADNSLRVWSIRQALYKGKLMSSSTNKPLCSLLAVMEGHKAPVKSICAWPCLHGCGCYTIYSGALDEAIKVWWLQATGAL